MAHVRYIATQSLVSGHANDSPQYINLRLSSMTKRRKSFKSEAISLNGQTYTTARYGVVMWACNTVPMNWTQTLQFREFMDSVEGGEQFSFSPTTSYGESPADLHAVVMDTDAYDEVRTVKRGDGGTNDMFEFTFTMREVPPFTNSLIP